MAAFEVRRRPSAPRPARRRLATMYTPDEILDAMRRWAARYGDVPAMADWDPTRARQLDQDWRIARYNQGDWPSARSVANHFGSFSRAIKHEGDPVAVHVALLDVAGSALAWAQVVGAET